MLCLGYCEIPPCFSYMRCLSSLLLLDTNEQQTRTFPVNGHFTPESRSIYDIVLSMQTQCTNVLKAGISWDEVHLLAHKIAIEGLLNLGIFKGNKEDILKQRTSVAFFPHGLGHYLGLDTHDTGGHPDYEDKDRLFRYLRVRGNLPEGSVVTVEPGVGRLLLFRCG